MQKLIKNISKEVIISTIPAIGWAVMSYLFSLIDGVTWPEAILYGIAATMFLILVCSIVFYIYALSKKIIHEIEGKKELGLQILDVVTGEYSSNHESGFNFIINVKIWSKGKDVFPVKWDLSIEQGGRCINFVMRSQGVDIVVNNNLYTKETNWLECMNDAITERPISGWVFFKTESQFLNIKEEDTKIIFLVTDTLGNRFKTESFAKNL